MATVYTEMLASMLAEELEDKLELLDGDEKGSGTFFAAASRVLSKNEMRKFVATARRKAVALRKEANGCPSRVFRWDDHYSD